MQDDGVAAGEEKDEDIGDLDDLLRREREMEKKRKESAPTDAEVQCMIRIYFLGFLGGVRWGDGGLSPNPLGFTPP